jgi:hypothetical protein
MFFKFVISVKAAVLIHCPRHQNPRYAVSLPRIVLVPLDGHFAYCIWLFQQTVPVLPELLSRLHGIVTECV